MELDTPFSDSDINTVFENYRKKSHFINTTISKKNRKENVIPKKRKKIEKKIESKKNLKEKSKKKELKKSFKKSHYIYC